MCPDGQELNDEGLCSVCNVTNCASCSAEDEFFCRECESGFKAKDGECICAKDGEKINPDGECEPCDVLGCESCAVDEPETCATCGDGMTLIDSKCFCEEKAQQIDAEGKCSDCLVDGCVSCAGKHKCSQCRDGLTLEDGLCQCAAESHRPNSAGECEPCNVEGCSSCESGNPDVCVKCLDCEASVIGGECSCVYEGAIWDSLGFCSTAEEEGEAVAEKKRVAASASGTQGCPAECEACEKERCKECRKGYYLEGNECLKCEVECASCWSGTTCEECKQGFFLGEDRKCEQGKVLNCASYEEGKCTGCMDGFDLVGESCEDNGKAKGQRHPSFEEFKQKYKKTYSSAAEEKKRQAIYNSNLNRLTVYAGAKFSVGVNHLSDQTEDEVTRGFKRGAASRKQNSPGSEVKWKVGSAAPEELDWRTRGVITSVKDQGSCGSCWAFGCAANAESVLILNGWENINVDLSEQYLLECTKESDCGGTYYVEYVMDEALEGVPRETDYPYNPFSSYNGICTTNDRVHIADENIFYYNLDDEEIIELLQTGPLAATISATGWSYYSGGIFECSSYASLNHVVQLVGYTEDYWIIKNEWGDDWGEDGYMRITRNPYYNCKIGSELFDFEKLVCGVHGCETCENEVCTKCKDDSAEIKEGECVCKAANEVMTDSGLCVACRVPGCEKCDSKNPDVCETCAAGTTGVGDGCECTTVGEKINPNGVCEVCAVQGCASCAAADSAVCVQCEDCSAVLESGLCRCGTGYVMNAEGKCQLCPVVACEDCVMSGNTATCQNCGEGKEEVDGVCQCSVENMVLENMVCKCIEGYREFEGSCLTCQLDNCLECITVNSSEHCTSCEGNTVLEDGYCW